MRESSYQIVAVGTGFATSFFLHRYLKNNTSNISVLVLEAGVRTEHAEQLISRGDKNRPGRSQHNNSQYINRTPQKPWAFFTGFGGASNAWWACTPRLLPEDFRLKSKYGIGADWPIEYDDLEPFYCDAEDLMQISGDSKNSPYPRSRPYPQTPHRLTDPDKALRAAYPDQVFCHPCARSTGPVPGQRGPCCNNGVCVLCPADA